MRGKGEHVRLGLSFNVVRQRPESSHHIIEGDAMLDRVLLALEEAGLEGLLLLGCFTSSHRSANRRGVEHALGHRGHGLGRGSDQRTPVCRLEQEDVAPAVFLPEVLHDLHGIEPVFGDDIHGAGQHHFGDLAASDCRERIRDRSVPVAAVRFGLGRAYARRGSILGARQLSEPLRESSGPRQQMAQRGIRLSFVGADHGPGRETRRPAVPALQLELRQMEERWCEARPQINRGVV